MPSAMQVAKPIQAVHRHRQCGKEPNDQHAVRMMMTEVLQAMEILGFVESLVFNLPATLGHAKQCLGIDFLDGKIR